MKDVPTIHGGEKTWNQLHRKRLRATARRIRKRLELLNRSKAKSTDSAEAKPSETPNQGEIGVTLGKPNNTHIAKKAQRLGTNENSTSWALGP